MKLTITPEHYPPLLKAFDLNVEFDQTLQMFRATHDVLTINMLSFQLDELVELVISDVDYLVDLYLVQKINIHESLKGAIAYLEKIIDPRKREGEHWFFESTEEPDLQMYFPRFN